MGALFTVTAGAVPVAHAVVLGHRHFFFVPVGLGRSPDWVDPRCVRPPGAVAHHRATSPHPPSIRGLVHDAGIFDTARYTGTHPVPDVVRETALSNPSPAPHQPSTGMPDLAANPPAVDLPASVNPNVPSAARAYDYFLGGFHNFEADRVFAEEIRRVAPHTPAVTRLNRSFLRRVVTCMVTEGITQFLDLGSGIPTVGNTHQIAQQLGVPARVVYVDQEPVAYYHAQHMLLGEQDAAIVQADMRDLPAVLDHPDTQRLLDFAHPVGLLIVGVALYLPDPDPANLIAAYREHLAPGSLIALSTLTEEHAGPELREEMARVRAAYEAAGEPMFPRDRAEILPWFQGLDLLDPGLVTLPEWRTDDPDELDESARPLGYGVVARVP
jgi:hypothetical protein